MEQFLAGLKEGESVKQDELIAEIETDKIVLEVLSPIDGEISKIIKNEGEIVLSGELIAEVQDNNLSSNITVNNKVELKTKEVIAQRIIVNLLVTGQL
ncbi:MAG: hypothetical protein CM15mP109_09600 [Candidatus Dadabacteria bacterium]|nr:MAG: hypothetical protein CM15mP109_09600 [Candidatus Dadabacteria bacterium]